MCGTRLDAWQDIEEADFNPSHVAGEAANAAAETPAQEKDSRNGRNVRREILGDELEDDGRDADTTREVPPVASGAETASKRPAKSANASKPAARPSTDAPRPSRAELHPASGEDGVNGQREAFTFIDASQAPVMARHAKSGTRTPEREDTSWSGNKKILLAILGSMAVLLLIIVLGFTACVGSMQVPTQEDDGGDSSVSLLVEDGADSSTSEPEEVVLTAEEQANKDAISEYSDRLPDLRSQVDEEVENFESLWQDERTLRENEQVQVQYLLDSLQADHDALVALGYVETDPFYEAWRESVSCYEDLIAAVQALANDWTVDLYYNYPSYYPDVIHTPYVTQTQEGGDIYEALSDYDYHYERVVFE